ncbi:MAG: hypothetical protein A4E53_00061 [Pelotomaculum sp. PtaB.Bin104]|nr:MAG: hypothetical protein A4E53_00061 [Pelotomaculum sp. PtaB.Bin104]
MRHWHNRDGGVYYDTITVRWDIIPDFIVESIDPGTQKAETGKTYTGKLVLKTKPDASFLSDPLTSELFNALGYKQELTQDYTVPFGVAVNGQLVPVKNLQPIPGLNNIYQYNVKAGKAEDTLEVAFDWTAGSGPITIAAGVNTTLKVLPVDAWNSMDWSELTNVNNIKEVEVLTDAVNLVAISIDPGVSGEAEPGGEYTATITLKNDSDKNLTSVPVGGFNRQYRAVLRDAGGNEVQYTDFAPGEVKTFYFIYHTPDAGTTRISGVIDTQPLEDLYKETSEEDNKVSFNVHVRETEPIYHDPRLNLQAYSQAGEDVYGNWHDSVARSPFTAKWTDDVKATLTVPRPKPPKGWLDWWEISWANVTYPKQNPDFMFGDPLPPQGTVTIQMNVPGQGLEEEKQATQTFQEDWGMDGAQIYNMIKDELMAEYPKNYPISVDFKVTYQYSYVVCDEDSCWVETAIGSYTATANGSLLVNGTGKGIYAQ